MSRTFLPVLAVCLLLQADAKASFIVGPGNVPAGTADGAFDIIAVDLNNPAFLLPGTYHASIFNFQFMDVDGTPSGTIAPLLLTGGGTSFMPVAIGSTLTYVAPTPFLSVPFGGQDTFTLASSMTVYGGLYWETTAVAGADLRMPVTFTNGTGSSFVVFGGGTGPGAVPPMVGVPISGSSQGFFPRTYDFSVEINAVPEPSSLVLAVVGAGVLGLGWLRRKKSG